MREARKTSATCAGTITFIAQVRSSRPLEPNLRPAMNTTFSIFGRRSISPRSSKSQAMHSTPQPSSFSRSPGSVKRATPTTRLPGAARLARRASVGPILPPTPRMRISPASRFSSAPSSGEGVVMTSSSWATSAMRSGSFKTRARYRKMRCANINHAVNSAQDRRFLPGKSKPGDSRLGKSKLRHNLLRRLPFAEISSPAILADLDDLHRVGAAGLAYGLADGEHDQVALLHQTGAQQHAFRLVQQFLALASGVGHHQRIGIAEQRAAVARGGARG